MKEKTKERPMLDAKDMAAQVLTAFKGHLESALTPVRAGLEDLKRKEQAFQDRLDKVKTMAEGSASRQDVEALNEAICKELAKVQKGVDSLANPQSKVDEQFSERVSKAVGYTVLVMAK